jgi:hypothetical protein
MCSAKAYKKAYHKVEMKAARTHLEVLYITGHRSISKLCLMGMCQRAYHVYKRHGFHRDHSMLFYFVQRIAVMAVLLTSSYVGVTVGNCHTT